MSETVKGLKTLEMERGSTTERSEKDVEAGSVDTKEHVPSPPAHQPEFPEGGLQGWATVFGASCVQFCVFGYSSSFGVFQDFYTREYLTSKTPSEVAWIGSVNAFLTIAAGLVGGRLYDCGYFKYSVYGGAFLVSFGLFMLSLAKPEQFYQAFLAQAVCVGIGNGLLYIPSLAVVSHYFQKKRTLAMSIVAAGSPIGSVVHPIMLNNTIHSSIGFATSLRASAGLVTGILLIAVLLMKPRIPPPQSNVAFGPALKKFSKDKPYVCIVLAFFFFNAGFWYPQYYIQLDAIIHKVNRTFAFYSLVIQDFCSLVARISAGFAAQKFGVANMITIYAGCCSAVIFGMVGLKDIIGFVFIGVTYGSFAGAYIAMTVPMVAVLTDNFSELGLRMGVSLSIGAIGGLIGGPIQGALLGKHFIWWRPAVFSGVLTFAGFCMFAAMRYFVVRRQATPGH